LLITEIPYQNLEWGATLLIANFYAAKLFYSPIYSKFYRIPKRIDLPPPFNAPPGRVGMEAANELFPFFKPRPEGRGR